MSTQKILVRPMAHVLINCDLYKCEEVSDSLRNVKGVTDVRSVSGAYDIVASVQSDTPESLKRTIVWKIRSMLHVRSTLTLLPVEWCPEAA